MQTQTITDSMFLALHVCYVFAYVNKATVNNKAKNMESVTFVIQNGLL